VAVNARLTKNRRKSFIDKGLHKSFIDKGLRFWPVLTPVPTMSHIPIVPAMSHIPIVPDASHNPIVLRLSNNPKDQSVRRESRTLFRTLLISHNQCICRGLPVFRTLRTLFSYCTPPPHY